MNLKINTHDFKWECKKFENEINYYFPEIDLNLVLNRMIIDGAPYASDIYIESKDMTYICFSCDASYTAQRIIQKVFDEALRLKEYRKNTKSSDERWDNLVMHQEEKEDEYVE